MCYTKAVIYKIVHNENELLVYVGSTCVFASRKHHHKHSCNVPNNKKYNYNLYKMIRENGGWDCFRMVIIEEYPCDNKTQLCIREEELRVEYNANMNERTAYGLDKQRVKEYQKEYRQDNKNQLIEYSREYNQQLNEKITCQCGRVIRKGDLNRHKKTKKHNNLLNK